MKRKLIMLALVLALSFAGSIVVTENDSIAVDEGDTITLARLENVQKINLNDPTCPQAPNYC